MHTRTHCLHIIRVTFIIKLIDLDPSQRLCSEFKHPPSILNLHYRPTATLRQLGGVLFALMFVSEVEM